MSQLANSLSTNSIFETSGVKRNLKHNFRNQEVWRTRSHLQSEMRFARIRFSTGLLVPLVA